eukprot:SAG22_NODE_3282_length_1806_cov_2.055653_1_plen_72_part_10
MPAVLVFSRLSSFMRMTLLMCRADCPDWQQNKTAGGDPDLTHARGVKINRKTWAWNAAAGSFAYAFGTLAER